MNEGRRVRLCAVSAVVLLLASTAVWAACTATFTADGKGTYPNTLKFDRKSGLLTVDLSAIPADAKIFRAELMLNGRGRFHKVPTKPTTVYPVEKPEKKLQLVGPRFVSLDALEAVKAAIAERQPLSLKLEVTLAGAGRLEVSYLEGKPRNQEIPSVSDLKVTHRAGQSLIVFKEPALEKFPEFKNGAEVSAFSKAFLRNQPGVSFRIWRGPEKITATSIAKAALVGECSFLTAWNSGYHQGGTGKAAPVRYRVTDGGEAVPWGTGIYAHNPARAGKAYYAVTVAVDGEENLDGLGDGNTTAEAVAEVVGQGEPVLQWVEQPKQWLYRRGPLTRLIYTRWEAWPHSSTPSKPIDYLVAMGNEPLPEKPTGEQQYKAWRVDPAPVGLHLHCWGASLNGGYGWWHNAHRGAVLIASNQIPYDWWTGYHEANGTCKTYGDGFVHPFTMNRTFGFLDFATKQWKESPEAVRKHWRKLDLTRVFTAGSSMGGSGAPMFAIRYGGRVAWCIAWVGVHIPAESPTFTGSYRGSYGPRDEAVTMADGKTSPWDHFSDVWWLRNNVKAETGFIMASNGKSDGGIGWPQAYKFARALQETRRPHLYNWGPGGHGTRTLVGANFDFDLRTDQTLPAFTNCTLDGNIGTGKMKTKAEVEAEREALTAKAVEAGKDPKKVQVLWTDGDPSGAYNAYLRWQTDDVVDKPEAWEMTVILTARAPKDSCKVNLTPRRVQKFRTPNGARFKYTVTDLQSSEVLATGEATADEYDLLTLKQIPLVKGRNRVRITPAK